MVPKTAITTTATTTPTKAGPFDHLTLFDLNEATEEGRHTAQLFTAALMRRIGVTHELRIRFSKMGKSPWTKSGGCRFNRMGIAGEQTINVTYQRNGSLEVTVNIETGDKTLEIMGKIIDLGINGQTLPQKTLAGQIRAIEQEVEELQRSRIVQMSEEVTVDPAKEPVVETPIFGMEPRRFIVYLGDIRGLIEHESAITIARLNEVSELTPDDWNPPRGQTLEELFEWLRNYGCIYTVSGLHSHKLNSITLHRLIEYRMENGVFPDMPSATALSVFKKATLTTGVLEPRKKRKYTKRQPKKDVAEVVPVTKKVHKPRRRSLCQVMAEFDLYFVVPLMQQLREKFDICLAFVSKDLAKAKKVFAQIEKLEAELAAVRSQRDRFEKLMREIVSIP